ncbi:hypothetical protein ACQGFJ_22915 [Rhodococcus sp. 3.70]
MNDANPPSPATVDRPALRRVAGSVLVGTTIEWYDFQIYGASAALVFAPLFFRAQTPRWRQFFPSPPSLSASWRGHSAVL